MIIELYDCTRVLLIFAKQKRFFVQWIILSKRTDNELFFL